MTAVTTTTQSAQQQHHHHPYTHTAHSPSSSSSRRASVRTPSSSDQSSRPTTSPRSSQPAAQPPENPATMPAAVMATAGASVTTSAGARPEAHAKPAAAQNGARRRNSSISHKRPSSAPGDNQTETLRPLSTNGLDQRAQTATRPSKPPLLRSKSDHPSRLLETSADSSNDEQTVVAAAEDFGTRHGFDGHYQSEDIISQLANVCIGFPYSSRSLTTYNIHRTIMANASG